MLDEHKMFEKFGGGETSKQGQAVETISCQVNNVSQFRQALRAGRGLVVMTLKCAVQNMEGSRLFPRPFRRGGDLFPHMGAQSVNGGTLEGGHRHNGGPNFDRLLYHTLKVLLLLSPLCISQFQA